MFVAKITTCTCGCEDCFEDGVCYCSCFPTTDPRSAYFTGEEADPEAQFMAAELAAEKPATDYNRATRKDCLAALKAAGYTGPTSYPMPKLREITAKNA